MCNKIDKIDRFVPDFDTENKMKFELFSRYIKNALF